MKKIIVVALQLHPAVPTNKKIVMVHPSDYIFTTYRFFFFHASRQNEMLLRESFLQMIAGRHSKGVNRC